MLHDFNQSLALSHEYEDAPWWGEVYVRAFPGFNSMMSVRKDGWAQRGGIDRVVQLKSGKTLYVDEKVRSTDWDDIALERWSDRDKQTPGWIQKDLACDFIAYAFVPTQRCYLLPFPTLRKAWQLEGRRWVELAEQGLGGFKVIHAKNKTYVTESIAVPTDLLMATLGQAMLVNWGTA